MDSPLTADLPLAGGDGLGLLQAPAPRRPHGGQAVPLGLPAQDLPVLEPGATRLTALGPLAHVPAEWREMGGWGGGHDNSRGRLLEVLIDIGLDS